MEAVCQCWGETWWKLSVNAGVKPGGSCLYDIAGVETEEKIVRGVRAETLWMFGKAGEKTQRKDLTALG